MQVDVSRDGLLAPSEFQRRNVNPLSWDFALKDHCCSVQDVHIRALAVREARSVVSAWKGY